MRDKPLWIFALAFFVVGDVVTTFFGLSLPAIAEAGPVAAPLYASYGFGSLIVMKVIFVAFAFLVWRSIASMSRLGIPMGLGIVGFVVTIWNSYVIGSVVL